LKRGKHMVDTLETKPAVNRLVPEVTAVRAVTSAEPLLPRRILVVDDNELAARKLQQVLEADLECQVDAVKSGIQALELLGAQSYSIVITDLRMPKMDGMELIRAVQERGLPVTLIVTTGHGSIDEAVQAIRLGAYDFLTKPIDLDHFRLVIKRALRERSLQDEVASLRAQLQTRFCFQNILSKNPHMHAVFELINNVAHTNTTVLIEGETGTGKEQVARAIHEASRHRSGPLVAVNCAALPQTLLESELFGHEKGSFTSAVGQRRGRFVMADGGSIFLDEVGDVPPTMQAKLLRVLQERRFERVGGTESVEVDVRVITATNRSLQKLVKQGKFREDLFYRLNVVKIDLPPLRERPEDIPLLAAHFAAKYAAKGEAAKRVAPDAMEKLLLYRWPGNIRELENAIERACVTCHENTIQVKDFPQEIVAPPAPKAPFHIDLDRPLPDLLREVVAQVEQHYIRKALKKAHGNVGKCARICGISRRSVSAKIAAYQFEKTVFRDDV
ncbi:MAG TPA: sigma-54 dependent transcriptional regulator, partial [Gemmataceae bacterium]|nr:sigma-54 dependent transcriptional regulator [Gemmataceae bacterium]